MTPDPHNHTFQLASDYINGTRQPVFLTGRAGTGKTTFLKHIKNTTPKQHVVLAPTGVAAINAGGTTIHSFFQLPFAPFIPAGLQGFNSPTYSADGEPDVQNAHSLIKRIKFSKEKRELLQGLELLIIDEISMVRADVLDAIDTVLRYFRHRPHEPFGGVQMLFIGDMFQLPPVVPNHEWDMLREFYSSPFFFDCMALKQNEPVYIELQKIYRQTDQSFIDVLNQVRNNNLDGDGFELLHSRYQPGFVAKKRDNFVTLSTHNAKADAINETELMALSGKAQSYAAEIQGEFSEKSYPADPLLVLKPGAQVMFIKNDLAKPRRFYNGKIGVVKSLEDDSIEVQCPDDDFAIKLGREAWTNVQYSLNRQEQRIDEKELGSFRQFPLRLAWAITIHKSQGLTFEKAIIDAGNAFAAGQVYVALSRCTSLEGLVLRSQIPATAVFTDPRIVAFGRRMQPVQALSQQLGLARFHFQLELLTNSFDGNALVKSGKALLKVLHDYPAGFNPEAQPWADAFLLLCRDLMETGEKFSKQIGQLVQAPVLPEDTPALQERLQKAAGWFLPKLTELIEAIKKQPAVTDSKEQASLYEIALADCYKHAVQWRQLLTACAHGFTAEQLLKARSKVQIGEIVGLAYSGSTKRLKDVPSDNPNPDLVRQLRRTRDELSLPKNTPIYLIANSKTIDEMARYLPQTLADLKKINGFGDVKTKQFGAEFLAVILDYCHQHGLEGNMLEKNPKRERKIKSEVAPKPISSTKQQSFDMLMQGLTPDEIAQQRGFVTGTIFSHLKLFVLEGKLPLEKLIAPEKQQQIETIILEVGADEFGPIKNRLPESITYHDIRLMRDVMLKKGQITLSEKGEAEV